MKLFVFLTMMVIMVCEGKMLRGIMEQNRNITMVSKESACIEGSFYYTGCRTPIQKSP